MRKLITLLCMFAFLQSFGLTHDAFKAMPKKAANGLVSAKKQELMKSPKVEKMAQRDKARQEAIAKKAEKKAAPARTRKAAEGETINVTLNDFAIENYCYDDYYNYLVMLYGNDENGDEYYLALDCYPQSKTWQGTFTTDDESLSLWSGINNYTSGGSFWLSEEKTSSFSVTLSSKEYYNISGTLYDEEGTAYNISGKDLFHADPKTYNMTGISWRNISYGDQVAGLLTTLDNAYFQLLFNTEELELGKEYTNEDIDFSSSLGYINHNYVFFESVSFILTKDEAGDEHISLKITADNGDTYNIEYVTPKLPEKFNDVYMTANCVDLYDFTASDGVWQMLGVSEDGEWNLSLAGIGEQLIGEYSGEQILTEYTYIGMSDLNVDLTLDYGKIENMKVVAGPTEGDYICTADVYCYNGNCYHLTLNHIRPAITEKKTMTAQNLKMYYDDWNECNILNAINDDYEFMMALPENATAIDGKDVQLSVCNRADDTYFDIYESYPFTIAYNEQGAPVRAEGKCLTKDGIEFTFDLSYVKPEPTRSEEFAGEIKTGEIRPTEDGFTVDGTSADGEVMLHLNVKSDKIAGSFGLTDVDNTDTYIAENASSSWDCLYMDVEDLDINITVAQENGKEMATITGTMLCVSQTDYKDVPLYTINMKVPVKRGFVKDEEDKDFEAAYTTEELSFVDHSAEEGWILVQGKNAASQSFAMVFFANAADPMITVPEGEYDINDTQAEGTVVASSGLNENGYQATASYAAQTDMLGFIQGNPWFMVNGKAIVKNVDGKLTISVTAKNSYNRNVLIGVNTEIPSGIGAVTSDKNMKTRKVIENRKVYIDSKNGLRYNMGGQRTK